MSCNTIPIALNVEASGWAFHSCWVLRPLCSGHVKRGPATSQLLPPSHPLQGLDTNNTMSSEAMPA